MEGLKCAVCGMELKQNRFECHQIYPFFNMVTHKSEDWEECAATIIAGEGQFTRRNLRNYVRVVKRGTEGLEEILQGNPTDLIEIVSPFGIEGVSLDSAFPVVPFDPGHDFAPVTVRLSPDMYQKLVAHELTFGVEDARYLRRTTQNVFTDLQTGKFPLRHNMRHVPLLTPKTTQTIYIPSGLKKMLDGGYDEYRGDSGKDEHFINPAGWLSNSSRVERLLLEYIERTHVTLEDQDLAFKYLNSKLSPLSVKARLRTPPKSQMINCILVEGLPDNKRKAIKDSLYAVDYENILVKAQSIEAGERTSFRVDFDDYLKLKQLKNEIKVPMYKLVTALLLLA